MVVREDLAGGREHHAGARGLGVWYGSTVSMSTTPADWVAVAGWESGVAYPPYAAYPPYDP